MEQNPKINTGEEHGNHQKYTCPMHPRVIRDGPGECPICGMALVPVKALEKKSDSNVLKHDTNLLIDHVEQDQSPALSKDQRSFQKYTCPMHPQVVQDGPGKCPLCSMTLVPLIK